MKKEKSTKKILGTFSSFVTFFLIVAFVISCCLMLFVTTLQNTLGYKFTQEQITSAAKATMMNVILISAGMAVVDYIRRKFTVERPVTKITEATQKMIEGDFSVRIPPVARFASDDHFNDIIERRYGNSILFLCCLSTFICAKNRFIPPGRAYQH